jgi:hypothetical protein
VGARDLGMAEPRAEAQEQDPAIARAERRKRLAGGVGLLGRRRRSDLGRGLEGDGGPASAPPQLVDREVGRRPAQPRPLPRRVEVAGQAPPGAREGLLAQVLGGVVVAAERGREASRAMPPRFVRALRNPSHPLYDRAPPNRTRADARRRYFLLLARAFTGAGLRA